MCLYLGRFENKLFSSLLSLDDRYMIAGVTDEADGRFVHKKNEQLNMYSVDG